MASNKNRLPRPFTHEDMLIRQLVASCYNCESFNKDKEICLMCNQRPPAQVIVFGCDGWEGEIPF